MRTAKRGIVELETGLAVTLRANEMLKEQVASPKWKFGAASVIVAEGLPAQTACRVCLSLGTTHEGAVHDQLG